MLNMRAGFHRTPVFRGAILARGLAAVALVVIYLSVPNAQPDLTNFNADDSEAYLALSYALTHGIGYTRSLTSGFYVPHTTWPPGMPLLLAPSVAWGGLPIDWMAVKATTLVLGLLGIGLAWRYLRRITGSAAAADLGALLFALAPFYWLFSRMALTEVPTVTLILAALLLMDHVWADRRPVGWQVALVGLFAGLGMLLRGTVAGLMLLPITYMIGTRRARAPRGRLVRLALLHMAAFCVPFIAWAARNHAVHVNGIGFDGINQFRMLFAVSPTVADSDLMTLAQIGLTAVDNLRYRIIYYATQQMLPGLAVTDWENWPHSAVLAVALFAALVVAIIPRRAAGWPLFLALAPSAGIMLIYAFGGAARFWVPITSLALLLVVVNFSAEWSRLRKGIQVTTLAGVTLAYGGTLAIFATQFAAHPMVSDAADMVRVFQQAGTLNPPPAATLTEHFALFALESGAPAPPYPTSLGRDPSFTHLVNRDTTTTYAKHFDVPAGSMELFRRGQWAIYALPQRMRLHQLAPPDDPAPTPAR